MHMGGGGTKESVGMIKLVGAAAREEMAGMRSLEAVDGVEEDAVTNGEAIDSGEKDGMWCDS